MIKKEALALVLVFVAVLVSFLGGMCVGVSIDKDNTLRIQGDMSKLQADYIKVSCECIQDQRLLVATLNFCEDLREAANAYEAKLPYKARIIRAQATHKWVNDMNEARKKVDLDKLK